MGPGKGRKDSDILLQSVYYSLESSNLQENYADELSGDEEVEDVRSSEIICSKMRFWFFGILGSVSFDGNSLYEFILKILL